MGVTGPKNLKLIPMSVEVLSRYILPEKRNIPIIQQTTIAFTFFNGNEDRPKANNAKECHA